MKQDILGLQRIGKRIGILLTFISFPNYINVTRALNEIRYYNHRHVFKKHTVISLITRIQISQSWNVDWSKLETDYISRSGSLWCLSRNSMSFDAGMFRVKILWFWISSQAFKKAVGGVCHFSWSTLSSFRNGFQSGTRWSYQAAQILRRQRPNETKREQCMT